MKRHSLDLRSLFAGLLFSVLAVVFALDQLDTWDVDVRWVPAILLLTLGAGGIAASVQRALRRPEPVE